MRQIFILFVSLLWMSVSQADIHEPQEMFTCDIKTKLTGYVQPDSKALSKLIECREVSALTSSSGPDGGNLKEGLLIWDKIKSNGVGWLKIKLEDNNSFYWVKERGLRPSVGIELEFRRKDTYFGILKKKWDKKLYSEPDSKSFIDISQKFLTGEAHSETIKIENTRFVKGRMWLKVSLYDEILCEPMKVPKKTFSGWIHFLNKDNEPVIYSPFCG
jgi:hypothetical protein